MTFAVGLFDLFTYAIPGSLYLAFFAHLVTRLHLVGGGTLNGIPAWLLVVTVVLVSYLLGYLAYPVGTAMNRLMPRRRKRDPRREFLQRVPAAEGREFVDADKFLLLSAIELHGREVAIEVTRLRAAGLMLRNSAPPLALGFGAAVIESIVGRNPVPAAGCAALLLAGFFALLIQGRRLRHWAALKTLELCFWIPDIDERCRRTATEGPAATPVPQATG